MNKPIYDGPPGLDNLPKPHQSAFPHPHVFGTYEDGDRIATGGMTLRAYMATKFMAAILANPASYTESGMWRNESETAAEEAVSLADALIEELAK